MIYKKPPVNWKLAALVAGFVGSIGLVVYPTMISPMLNPEPYKQKQAITRKNLKQEDIQPGNMRVWSDPFGPLPTDKPS